MFELPTKRKQRHFGSEKYVRIRSVIQNLCHDIPDHVHWARFGLFRYAFLPVIWSKHNPLLQHSTLSRRQPHQLTLDGEESTILRNDLPIGEQVQDASTLLVSPRP